jgi:hypothetical protein
MVSFMAAVHVRVNSCSLRLTQAVTRKTQPLGIRQACAFETSKVNSRIKALLLGWHTKHQAS